MTTWKDGLPAPARAILRSAEEDDVDDLMHDRMKKRLAGALVASAAVAGATTAAAGASSATSTATVAMGAGASSVAPAAGAAVVKGIGGAVAAKWIGVATLALVSASAAVTFVAPKPSPTEDRMAVEAPLEEAKVGQGAEGNGTPRGGVTPVLSVDGAEELAAAEDPAPAQNPSRRTDMNAAAQIGIERRTEGRRHDEATQPTLGSPQSTRDESASAPRNVDVRRSEADAADRPTTSAGATNETGSHSAAATAPATAPEENRALQGELALLAQLRRHARDRPASALGLAREHASRFGDASAFTPERELYRIEALMTLGRRSEARVAATAFERRFGSSPYVERVRRMTAAAP